MRRDCIPSGDFLPLDWVKKGRISIFSFGILKSYTYFVLYVTGFKFEELFLVAEDSEDKIAGFLSLPMAYRSLKPNQSDLEEGSPITASMATGTHLFTF